MERVKSNPNVQQELAPWGVNYESNPLTQKARVLPQEKLLMSGDDYSQDAGQLIDKGDFSRLMFNRKMVASVVISKWCLIAPVNDRRCVNDMCDAFKRVCPPLGINIGPPQIKPLEGDRASDYIRVLQSLPSDATFVLCVVPNNRKDRYDAIKKYCCVTNPIPSQVVVNRTLLKKDKLISVATKICIQIACKLGAEAWRLFIPPKNIMVIGYDTWHDSARKARSAGGFVCSLNNSLTKYYSILNFHEGRDEMSGNFAGNTKKALIEYHKVNKRFPEKVIIYRDGVGEGNIDHVKNVELAQVIEAINETDGGATVKLAFVIVSKRVNTKFLAIDRQNSRYGNPPPGSVVDTIITRRGRSDFFLVAQNVTQGTVTPTSYDVIHDTTGWKLGHHQMLAYKLAHLYYNWQGTVKVPAPCQYAHKLAYLAGESLHDEPSPQLSNSLFYL